ncbi:group I truncated hemoglobin [Algihabitans albus]|uniref:group I truncated hemoglobin n=1 Tax=Algihabitans albus TaxID=2164067 RepID=UPI000E5CE52A|nr:group 1 truncated hemoglobin [Algihabitans albus]
MPATAFERYGGFAAISKVVMAFYDKVLDSEVIGAFFDEVDMRRLIDHQTKFISQALGGPVCYSDRQLRQLHAHLDIDPNHFDEMARLLRETLLDFDFAPDNIGLVMEGIERRRPYVITRP